MASPYIITRGNVAGRRKRGGRGFVGAREVFLRPERVEKFGHQLWLSPVVSARFQTVSTPPTVTIFDSVTGLPVERRVDVVHDIAAGDPGFQSTAEYGDAGPRRMTTGRPTQLTTQTAFAGSTSTTTKRKNAAIGAAIVILIGVTVASQMK